MQRSFPPSVQRVVIKVGSAVLNDKFELLSAEIFIA